jgi:hypothetical protein
VHWASADLLAFLAAAGESGGAHAVVATARPSLLETAAEWCGGAELLALSPLAPADATELPQSVPLRDVSHRLVRRAQKAGALRRDLTPTQVYELVPAASRFPDVILDGLGAKAS